MGVPAMRVFRLKRPWQLNLLGLCPPQGAMPGKTPDGATRWDACVAVKFVSALADKWR